MRILFFGRLSEVAGASEREVALPPGVSDLAGLRSWLARQDGRLGEAMSGLRVRTAVNGTLATGNVPLAGNEEVAFMSPVSGG